MAKGNDGNLLQHFTECQVASRLSEDVPALHLVCTHAMEPFSEAKSPEDPFNTALRSALRAATPEAAWPLLRAYARTGASLARYPNSAELLAALLGEARLSGVLCEKDEIRASVLQNRWARGGLFVRPGTWRTAVESGRLDPPAEGDRAWLFSMDPHTWLMASEQNRASRGPNLCAQDFERLRPILGRYAQRSAPGALIVCVYGVDEPHAARFRRAAIQLADRLGLERTLLGLPARGGARHLAAVLSPTAGLPARVAEDWSAFRAEVPAG